LKVVVVGGGVIGLACAWFLREGGAEVVVLERDGAGMAASRGNAGWITPGLSNPLPSPGVTLQALRWMLRSDSPFLLRPRLDPDFAAWLWRFWRSSARPRYLFGMQAMLALNARTFELYDRLVADGVEFEMHKGGLLFLFLDEGAAEEEAAVLEDLRRYGYSGEVRRLTTNDLDETQPVFSPDGSRVAFWFPSEGKRGSANAIWEQQYVWPFRADYRISYVADDYSAVIVTRLKRDYVWIMARQRSIPEAELRRLADFVAAQGYDPNLLKRMPHGAGG